jgi:hypothetical protein
MVRSFLIRMYGKEADSKFGKDIYCSHKTVLVQTHGLIKAIECVHEELRSWIDKLPHELKLVGGIAQSHSALILHMLHNHVNFIKLHYCRRLWLTLLW